MMPTKFMRPIDRVRAVQQISSAMQSSMNWNDVRLFFGHMQVPAPQFVPGFKPDLDDLIRGFLSKCSDEDLLDIGHQLGLDVPHSESGLVRLGDSKHWLIDHFRLFISHVHTVKLVAQTLSTALKKYSISAFVAHEDIEPSDEWREEILRSLMSMDALATIQTPDFGSSEWTDQEVGLAVARDVLIIPISKGENPYGFIAKYQALPTSGKTVKEVAATVFRTICSSPRSQDRMVDCLVRTISTSSNVDEVLFRLDKLNEIEAVGIDKWESIRENLAASSTLRQSKRFIDAINVMLTERKIAPIEFGESKRIKPLDDEIPF